MATGVVCGLLAVGLGVLLIRTFGIRTTNGEAAARPALPARVAHAATGSADVATGFSSLRDPGVPTAPAAVVAEFRSIHQAAYADAKAVGDGMYLATYGTALCSLVRNGLGGCTDHLNAPDALVMGQIGRQYDSETAPFETRVYGFARDGVRGFRISTADGKTTYVPVRQNAFDTVLRDTSFGGIVAIVELYRDGRSAPLRPSDYFPDAAPGH